MIADLLAPAAPPPPSVRRPVFAVAFGAAAAGAWSEAVVSLTVETGLAPAVDRAEVVLAAPAARGGGGPAAAAAGAAAALGGALGLGSGGGGGTPADTAPGDAGTISLGYRDGGPAAVFAGAVEAVERRLDGALRLTAASGAAALARLRVEQAYQRQSAGDVVRDLAGRAGVAAGTIEDGIALPYFVVEDRRPAWAQVAELAARCGFLAAFTAEGELDFRSPSEGEPVAAFAYGGDVLSMDLVAATPAVAGRLAVGEGAAGSHGGDAWAWLVKDPSAVTSEAGGAPLVRRPDGALRSAAAAASAARGAAFAAGLAAAAGTLVVPGAPAVVPGATVTVAGAPRPGLDGSFLVRRVRHSYSKRSGFTTRIEIARRAAGGGLAGGLAAAVGGLP